MNTVTLHNFKERFTIINFTKQITSIFAVFLCMNVQATEPSSNHEHKYEIKKSKHANFEIDSPIGIDALTITLKIGEEIINFELYDNEQLDKFKARSKGQRTARFLRGRILGKEKSWARFRLLNGKLRGAFFDGESLQLLQREESSGNINSGSKKQKTRTTDTTEEKGEQLIVFSPSDVLMTGSCANHAENSGSLRFGQEFDYQQFVEELSASVAQSNLAQATSEVGITIVADQSFMDSSFTYNDDLLGYMNFVQGIFESQVGVFLRLDEVIEFTDESTLNSNDPYTLLPQLTYLNIPNYGIRHLLTGRDLAGSTVGIAYVSQLCNAYSAGVTQNFGSLTGLIFAHELGHNFGAPHDNQTNSLCQSTPSGFIMNPNINAAGDSFSSCSIEQIEPVLDYYQNLSNVSDQFRPSFPGGATP